MPSLLDRLTDPELAVNRARGGYNLNQMIKTVIRDVGNLLNTRRGFDTDDRLDPFSEYPQLHDSILAYGIPDLPSLRAMTGINKEGIRKLITEVITRFEPRLRNVRIRFRDDKSPTEMRASGSNAAAENAAFQATIDEYRSMHFEIQAILVLSRAPVTFVTKLQLNTGKYEVAAS